MIWIKNERKFDSVEQIRENCLRIFYAWGYIHINPQGFSSPSPRRQFFKSSKDKHHPVGGGWYAYLIRKC